MPAAFDLMMAIMLGVSAGIVVGRFIIHSVGIDASIRDHDCDRDRD